MGERQAEWTSDGPDFEYMEAGLFVLEVARGRDGERFRWSSAIRLGGVEHCIGTGRRGTRSQARFQCLFTAHRWLADAVNSLPTMDTAAASLRASTPPRLWPRGDLRGGGEDCNGAA